MKQDPNHNLEANEPVNEQLSRDLKVLYQPLHSTPAELDGLVMNQFRQSQARRIRLRWVRYAAAAMVLLTLGLIWMQRHQSNPPASSTQLTAVPMDIDHNGTVNILDALQLAQHIESHSTALPQGDFNSDGIIDRRDVDLIAHRAVRLPHEEVL